MGIVTCTRASASTTSTSTSTGLLMRVRVSVHFGSRGQVDSHSLSHGGLANPPPPAAPPEPSPHRTSHVAAFVPDLSGHRCPLALVPSAGPNAKHCRAAAVEEVQLKRQFLK